VLTVPNAALRFAPVSKEPKHKQAGSVEANAQQHVWLLRDEVPVEVEVVVGVSDGIVTEILSGDLELGSQVIIDAVEPAT
jgi:HlyD family secretion protein